MADTNTIHYPYAQTKALLDFFAFHFYDRRADCLTVIRHDAHTMTVRDNSDGYSIEGAPLAETDLEKRLHGQLVLLSTAMRLDDVIADLNRGCTHCIVRQGRDGAISQWIHVRGQRQKLPPTHIRWMDEGEAPFFEMTFLLDQDRYLEGWHTQHFQETLRFLAAICPDTPIRMVDHMTSPPTITTYCYANGLRDLLQNPLLHIHTDYPYQKDGFAGNVTVQVVFRQEPISHEKPNYVINTSAYNKVNGFQAIAEAAARVFDAPRLAPVKISQRMGVSVHLWHRAPEYMKLRKIMNPEIHAAVRESTIEMLHRATPDQRETVYKLLYTDHDEDTP